MKLTSQILPVTSLMHTYWPELAFYCIQEQRIVK